MNEVGNVFEAMTEEQLQQIAGGIDENGILSDEACKKINQFNLPPEVFPRMTYGGPVPKHWLHTIIKEQEKPSTNETGGDLGKAKE